MGGLALAAAGQALVHPLRGVAATTPAGRPCAPTPPGIATGAIAATRSGRTVWTVDAHGSAITAHAGPDLLRGRSIDVGGTPAGLALSPDGTLALVTTAFFDHPGVVFADLRTGEAERIDAGPDPRAVAFAPDGRRAYVAGGGPEGTLRRIDVRARRVHGPVAVGAHPRDVAVLADGEHALVTLNGEAALALVDVVHGRVVRRIATRSFPYRAAVAPDGARALVTHNGFGERRVTPVDLHGFKAGRAVSVGLDPAGVAYSPSGALAVVAAAGSGRVSVLDGRSGRRVRHHDVGGAPRGVATAGRRAYVADQRTGAVRALRLGVRA